MQFSSHNLFVPANMSVRVPEYYNTQIEEMPLDIS